MKDVYPHIRNTINYFFNYFKNKSYNTVLLRQCIVTLKLLK